MITITTQSGSIYQFEKGRVRRVNSDFSLRRDEDWIELHKPARIVIGEPMQLILEPLGENKDGFTRRDTTIVKSIKRGQ